MVTPSATLSMTTRFQLYVNNAGALAQIYNLSATYASGPVALPPAGWLIAFKLDGGANNCSTITGGAITSTGAVPIPAGGNRLICAEVTVPATNTGTAGTSQAAIGSYVIEFRVEQQSNTAIYDTKRDQVTILALHNVTLTPNGAQNTVPGGSVTYSHVLSNSGNATEAITFPGTFLADSQVPTYSWGSTAYIDTNNNGMLDIGTDTPITNLTTFMMAPNTTQVIFVRVNAPAMAGSPPDITTVTATYNAGGSTTSANDTTTLNNGLKLDKYQQLPTDCITTPAVTLAGNIPAGPWSASPILAGPNTVPGKCIAYLIVGTNISGANITNVAFSDAVPPNTTLQTTCGGPVVTGPVALIGAYVTGYSGSITGQSTGIISPTVSNPLVPNGLFTLQFCVKIN